MHQLIIELNLNNLLDIVLFFLLHYNSDFINLNL